MDMMAWCLMAAFERDGSADEFFGTGAVDFVRCYSVSHRAGLHTYSWEAFAVKIEPDAPFSDQEADVKHVLDRLAERMRIDNKP